MKCTKCSKEIDKDSLFCIFCGIEIEKDLSIKKTKNSSAIKPLLISFNVIFVIAIIILSILLSGNLSNIEDYKKKVKNLSSSITSLEGENTTISDDLNILIDDYSALKSNYNNLQKRYDNLSTVKNTPDTTSDKDTNYQTSYYDNSEVGFLNNVLGILDEYNLAVNHMNTYHSTNWIFNDPKEIALEETFLVRLNELLNELKSFNCPASLTSQKSNLIAIFGDMYNYKLQQIDCMKHNNYECNINNYNSFEASVVRLFDYYNSLVR